MAPETRELGLFHLAFGAVAAGALLAPGDVGPGWRMAGLVVLYHVATVVITTVRGHRAWRRRWWFGAVLSVWMVLPDAVLAEGLGTLRFPADGFPDLGPVTGYMAGLWTIPIVLIVTVAEEVGQRRGEGA